MRFGFILLAVVTASAAFHSTAGASWSELGMLVDSSPPSHGLQWLQIVPSSSGDLFLLQVGLGASYGWDAQRVTAAGTTPWGTRSLGLIDDWLIARVHTLTPDESGGCFHAGWDLNGLPRPVILQHVRNDGVLEPTTWPPYWVVDTVADAGIQMETCGDGAGGVYIALGNRGSLLLQHRLQNGTVAAGWSPLGRVIAPIGVWDVTPCARADGSGGAIVFWANDKPRAIRILADSTIAPGWPMDGLILGAGTQFYGYLAIELPKLLPSGPNGVLAVWSDADAGDPRVLVQRFDFNGALDPDWPPLGRLAMAPSSTSANTKLTAVSDGIGGVHVLWERDGLPRWTHVLASGAFAPGFDPGGISPLPASAHYQHQWANTPNLVGAASVNGGLMFAWPDSVGPFDWRFRVRWMDSNGALMAGEPDSGRGVPNPGNQTENILAATPDGVGGAYLAWMFGNYLGFSVWMNEMLPNTLTPVLLSLADVWAEPDAVHLRWTGRGVDASRSSVFRRTSSTVWTASGPATGGRPDELRYDDHDVRPGVRYGYRLEVSDAEGESVSAETWVTVPERTHLELAGLRPNPVTGAPVRVAFSLADDSPAQLEILDIQGRRVMAREVEGAGDQVVAIVEALPAGVYLIRLRQSGRTLTTRGVVTR